MLSILCISIEKVAAFISLILPVILLWWFYYTQRDIYFKELIGVYGGYPPEEQDLTEDGIGRKDSGLIMNITDVVSGYFRGEIDYLQNINSMFDTKMKYDGNCLFYGKLNFAPRIPQSRNPMRKEENRIYYGKLYIVQRLDIDYKNQNIDTFLVAEYDIVHYHEMRVLDFKISKRVEKQGENLPDIFGLYKSLNIKFEPTKTIKETVFRGFKNRFTS